jgi:RNA polymerase sigma-70 factor (ECF subfamily)
MPARLLARSSLTKTREERTGVVAVAMRDGDEVAQGEAVAAVVARERPRLLALARRLVWDAEEAKDVVQAALVDVVAKAPAAMEPSYLRRAVVNRALSHLRRRKVWRVLEAVLLVEPEPVGLPDDAAEQSEHARCLGAALEKLPARQSVAFTLRYLEGLSLDEVAAAMRIEKGTVRIHVQRAVQALRDAGVLT